MEGWPGETGHSASRVRGRTRAVAVHGLGGPESVPRAVTLPASSGPHGAVGTSGTRHLSVLMCVSDDMLAGSLPLYVCVFATLSLDGSGPPTCRKVCTLRYCSMCFPLRLLWYAPCCWYITVFSWGCVAPVQHFDLCASKCLLPCASHCAHVCLCSAEPPTVCGFHCVRLS